VDGEPVVVANDLPVVALDPGQYHAKGEDVARLDEFELLEKVKTGAFHPGKKTHVVEVAKSVGLVEIDFAGEFVRVEGQVGLHCGYLQIECRNVDGTEGNKLNQGVDGLKMFKSFKSFESWRHGGRLKERCA
jgi:hypothetical protein